jgi:hypothetical protein
MIRPMNKNYIVLVLLLFTKIGYSQTYLPVNKYNSDNGQKHKERSKGIVMSVGYPVISQFLNPIFVGAKQSGQMQKADNALSFYVDANVIYPFSIQVGGYSAGFRPDDNLVLSNGSNGKDVEVSHELLEGFVCSKLLPNKSRFLPYIGVGYIDGGLKLVKRNDTAKERTILSAIKIQSPAWRIGMTIDVIRESGIGDVGLMVDYMQPFQISGLLPNTFYPANRLQVGLFVRYN